MTTTHTGFRLLLAGNGLSAAGTGIAAVAVSIHFARLGAGWVGLVGVLEILPAIALASAAGLALDRMSHRRLLIAATAAQVAVFVAGSEATGGSTAQAALLAALIAAVGAATAFAQPAASALVPLVAPENTTRAAGHNAIAGRIGYLAGFAIGGLLTQSLSIASVFVSVAAVNAAAAGAFCWISQSEGSGLKVAAGRRDGKPSGSYSTLLRSPARATVISFVVMLTFAVMVNVADVFFVTRNLHAGALAYGVITACWPLGGIAGGWLVSRLGETAVRLAPLVGCLVMGLALLAAAGIPSLPVMIAAWIVGGAANAAQRASVFAYIYERVSAAERGRVLAATGGLIQVAQLAGLGLGAAVVGLSGARVTLLAAGAVLVALASVRRFTAYAGGTNLVAASRL